MHAKDQAGNGDCSEGVRGWRSVRVTCLASSLAGSWRWGHEAINSARIYLKKQHGFRKGDALRDHGVSQQIIWTLQHMYRDQVGQISNASIKHEPNISHQRKFSTRLRQEPAALLLGSTSGAFKLARARVEHHGVDLNDEFHRLLDLRFADDLLLFPTTATNAAAQLDEICAALRSVVLTLNAKTTRTLTTETQRFAKLAMPQNLTLFPEMKLTNSWGV